jgi:glucokinase
VVFSPNLPDWNGMKVGELFRRSTNMESVIVENDADAAAWGELWFGAGREIQDMMCVLCDVGVGSGLVINRQLVRGQDNSVGEIGHIFVDSHGPAYTCGCGHEGCLEAVASLGALNRYLTAGMTQGEALDRIAKYIGMALGSIVNVLCPQIVVLGGAMLQSYPVLWPLIVQNTRARVLNHLMHKTQFILSPLGDYAPLLGLADLVFERRLQIGQGAPVDTVPPSQWGRTIPDSLKFF